MNKTKNMGNNNFYVRTINFLFGDYQNKFSNLILSLFLFTTSGFLYLQYGLKGFLHKDEALYAYMGQQLAKGVPPYISAFDIKTPMTAFLAGFGAWIGNQLEMDDLIAIRITFLLMGCAVVVAIYYLGSFLYKSAIHGLISACVFIAFYGFGRAAASGPNPKTPLVLFVVLSLLAISKKSYFWSAFFASLAFLTWQPAGILLIVFFTFVLLQTTSKTDRVDNIRKFLIGGSFPLIIVVLYFLVNNAIEDFVYSAFSYHFIYYISSKVSENISIIKRLLGLVYQIHRGMSTMLYPIMLSIISIPIMIMRQMNKFDSFLDMLRMDKWFPFYISLIFNFAWILFDIQSYPDLFIVLPYIAIIFAHWLYLLIKHIAQSITEAVKHQLVGYTLITVVAFSILLGVYGNYKWQRLTPYDLETQSKWAMQIQNKIIKNQQFVVFGVTEILVLLDYTNDNKYVHWTNDEDEVREYQTGASLNYWLDSEIAPLYTVIILGSVKDPETKLQIIEWLKENEYSFERVGDWFVYTRSN